MTELQKMMNGEPFDGGDAEICALRDSAYAQVHEINQCGNVDKAQPLLAELLAAMGEESLIRPPFCCEFGKNIRVGRNSFLNCGVTMLDGAPITLGDNVMVGPNVQFYTASHSLNHLERRSWATFCKPITVEDDVWIGGNAVIHYGVTIGARSVVAANSVVNRDVPPDSLVGGTPAKVIKQLA
ncbi:sugar O-acetyltransferase [Shewanella corallii]|uniref:Sugar O-acetyltransferase n=1 Tax=Shewanella corallii TaxID=560080 RepID=A0ABT0N307_9GAMM|nr:sugar O-acetyltransferase [Shewanella corallii]MCL2912271.1 sugar O-acetyltransferase [Shewanella corallii]